MTKGEPMSLRELAREALPVDVSLSMDATPGCREVEIPMAALMRFRAAADPQTVLGLLDALDVAVEELKRSNDLCCDTACCRSTAAALARIRELTEGENDGT